MNNDNRDIGEKLKQILNSQMVFPRNQLNSKEILYNLYIAQIAAAQNVDPSHAVQCFPRQQQPIWSMAQYGGYVSPATAS